MEKREDDRELKFDNRERLSVSKRLRNENRSNDLFEIMLSSLTIEEIISLKMELISRTIGSNIYGIPLWRCMNFIVKDAMLKYALAVTRSKKLAAQFLGLDLVDFHKEFHLHNLKEYIEEMKSKNEVKPIDKEEQR